MVFVYSNEAMQNVGMPQSASEMENQVFQKSGSQDEYRNTVAKIVVHMQSKNMDMEGKNLSP